jgi:cysteine synthase
MGVERLQVFGGPPALSETHPAEIAARPDLSGKVVVTVAPSTGERYLSTKLWEEL